jgi:hypothetical protein
VLLGQSRDLVVVDPVIVAPYAVLDRLEPFAGLVGARTMGQVPARGERHAENGVAGLEQRQKDGLVGLCARMRLHVGEGAVEQPARTLDGQPFGDIDEFAAAVIAPSRIAFGVFVGEDGPLRLENRAADDILRSDQFDLVLLASQLGADRRVQFRIGLRQGCVEETGRGCVDSAWRPPANCVARNAARQSRATSAPVVRAPRTSTLASLCSRASLAVVASWQSAARTWRCRLAAIEIPTPDPQMRTPSAARPSASAAASRSAKSE